MSGGDRSLISEIYETAVIPERWLQVFEKIATIAGADGGFMATTKMPNGERSWVATESQKPILSDWYAEGWHLRNTWAKRGNERKRLHFFDETDLFAPGEIDTIPMYRDFHRPRGGGWSAGALMKIPGGGGVCFRFERPYHQGPMGQEVRARLNRLRPHLARGALLFSKLGLRQAQAATSALQVMDIPAAILTRHGRLLACNTAMEQRLSQVIVRAGDRISFQDKAAHTALKDSLARITSGLFDQVRGPIPLPATEDYGSAVAYLIPMRGTAQDVFGCETTLLMIRPADSESRLMDLVRTRFAIEAGEAQRVAHLISSTYPRLAATLLATTETMQATLDRVLGRTRSGLEARLASFLWNLGEDPADSRFDSETRSLS